MRREDIALRGGEPVAFRRRVGALEVVVWANEGAAVEGVRVRRAVAYPAGCLPARVEFEVEGDLSADDIAREAARRLRDAYGASLASYPSGRPVERIEEAAR